jgi:hypothetical protein
VTRKQHPFEGRSLAVLGWTHWRGARHLVLVHPDGTRSLIPASWTDLAPSPSRDGGRREGGRRALARNRDVRPLRSWLACLYSGRNATPGYYCGGATIVSGRGEHCMRVGGLRIDEDVSDALIMAITPAGLEASLRAVELSQAENSSRMPANRRPSASRRRGAVPSSTLHLRSSRGRWRPTAPPRCQCACRGNRARLRRRYIVNAAVSPAALVRRGSPSAAPHHRLRRVSWKCQCFLGARAITFSAWAMFPALGAAVGR